MLVFMVAFMTTGGTLGYLRLQGNINSHDVSDLLGTDRPIEPTPTDPAASDAHAGETLNILMLGSDSRDGDNSDYGDEEGMRADAALLVQIPPNRRTLTVVSIPRDTLVDIPACVRPDGTSSSPQRQAMFNSAFTTGAQNESIPHGAACTIKTVEALTGVLIDDFVVVDFSGFTNVVDALGGIPMDVPFDISDAYADLSLAAGCQILDGHDALGFARVRKSVPGDGSDISRIGRQQDLLAAIIKDTLSTRVLTNPVRLYEVADRATQTITTGHRIGSLTEIVGLAASLRNLNLDEVLFITMPFDYAGARVVPNATYAPQVWESLRSGQPIDPRLTGVGWEIAEQIAADEAAAQQPTESPAETPSETPSDAPTDTATDTPTPEGNNPPAEETPEEPPACTRETARK